MSIGFRSNRGQSAVSLDPLTAFDGESFVLIGS